MPKSFKLNGPQEEALEALRKRLGDEGYYTFTVAKRWRRHFKDFVAVKKLSPSQFVWVTPYRHGTIGVRPFRLKCMYPEVTKALKKMHRQNRCADWGPQITPERKSLTVEHFLTPLGLKQFQALGLSMQNAG